MYRFRTYHHNFHRTWHSDLMHSHNTLTHMYAKATKRPHTEDHAPDLVTRASVTPHDHCKEEESQPTTVPAYSRSDFPNITYWTREEFAKFEAMKKNSTDPTSKTGGRGKTRCANDENVNSTYLEQSDGTPLSGKKVGAIRAYARSIWVDLYTRGMAPKKWSNASRRVHDEYVLEMENRWPILRYCQDHWKAHLITTKNYSQWYIPYDKRTREDNEKETKGPAPKKLKMMTEDDYTGVSQTDTPPEDSDDNDNNNDNDNDSPAPSWLKNDVQEGSSRGASRPKPRPLMNPL